jgi:hypothetical protein
VCAVLDSLVRIDALGVIVSGFDTSTTSQQFGDKVHRNVSAIETGLRGVAQTLPEGHALRVYLAAADAELAYVLFKGLNKMRSGNRDPEHIGGYEAVKKHALEELARMAAAAEYADIKASLDRQLSYYRTTLANVIP